MDTNASANNTVDPKQAGKLACESCGTEFTCNAGQETCWCFDVEVSPDSLETIRENFKNCLCKNCLEKFQVNKQ